MKKRENKQATKKSILASGISLMLCIAMFIGITFAWFTDSASSKGNRIESGTLEMDVIGFAYNETNLRYDAIGSFKDTATPPVINETNWQPGAENTKYLVVYNQGTVDFEFDLNFIINDGGLADALWYKFAKVDQVGGEYGSAVERVSLSEFENADIKNQLLLSGKNIVYRLDYGMLESAGNSYQNKFFMADINVIASQVGQSSKITKVFDENDLTAPSTGTTYVLMDDIKMTGDITLDYCNIDLNGYTLDIGNNILRIENENELCTSEITNGNAVNGNIIFNIPKGSAYVSGKYINVDWTASVSENTFVFDAISDGHIIMECGRYVAETNSAINNVELKDDSKAFIKTGAIIETLKGTEASKIDIQAGAVVSEIGGSVDQQNIKHIAGQTENGDVIPVNANIVMPSDSLQAAIDKAAPGDTIYISNGSHKYDDTVNVNKTLNIVGLKGNLVEKAVISVSADNTALINLNYSYTGKDTTYGNLLIYGNNVKIENCSFYADYTSKMNGDKGTEGGSRFGFVYPVGKGLVFNKNTIKSNAMGLFTTSFVDMTISNCYFANLDGYTVRTLAINCSNMSNVTIKDNILVNRHILIGGTGTITGNYFKDLGANGTGKAAITLWADYTGEISNNDCGIYKITDQGLIFNYDIYKINPSAIS